jgi:chromosome segregation ATPase
MIAKLQQQSVEEANHESFCKEELAKSSKSRDQKSAAADKYKARIDGAKAAHAGLKSEIAELQQELSDISKAVKEATELRSKEKASYESTSKDYKESAEAIVQALAVLKEFYRGDASLLQANAAQPEFGSSKSDASDMILGILETAESDFTKMLAEAESAESEAQDAFEKLIQENKVSKAAKETAVAGKTSEMKSLEVALSHHEDDLDTVSKELDAVLDYLEKLKPQCTSRAMTYEERKAKREAEMEGLKEALSILEGDSVAAFIQKKGFLHKKL